MFIVMIEAKLSSKIKLRDHKKLIETSKYTRDTAKSMFQKFTSALALNFETFFS